MATRERDRDRELLIPVGEDGSSTLSSPSTPSPPPPLHAPGREAFSKVIRSWASKKFMTGCVILLPLAITFYITWWFIHFVDGFFSPIYAHLGINVFGLGFVTSITFIFLVGIFMSSWLGASVLGLGEWFIKKMPLMCHIYSASKQISAAISPDQSSRAFKEVAILRHPRAGEYAIGFITSTVILRTNMGDEELCCVYIPTNHLYLGDIFLVNSEDVIRPNLSVREAIGEVIAQDIDSFHFSNMADDFCPCFRNCYFRWHVNTSDCVYCKDEAYSHKPRQICKEPKIWERRSLKPACSFSSSIGSLSSQS